MCTRCLHPRDLSLFLDLRNVEPILSFVIDNAIEFSFQGSRITLLIRIVDHSLVILVTNKSSDRVISARLWRQNIITVRSVHANLPVGELFWWERSEKSSSFNFKHPFSAAWRQMRGRSSVSSEQKSDAFNGTLSLETHKIHGPFDVLLNLVGFPDPETSDSTFSRSVYTRGWLRPSPRGQHRVRSTSGRKLSWTFEKNRNGILNLDSCTCVF